ncbi:substrate-binding periplasmic protein [Vogesella oryzae]|uniref:substrate-binding periplasmic protein n=1 Tax=Vogesella oryzae TaxID=1735285 RepID=UPI001583A1D6|nr:transporter substrate-binding domain-containing protein [Vogesella oryzae]
MKPRTLACLLSLAAPALQAADLTIYTADYPPLSIVSENGRNSGIGYDLLQLAAKQSGVSLDIRSDLPWKRAQQTTQQTPDTCAYPLTRAPEREKLYLWLALLNRGELALFTLDNGDAPASVSLAAAARQRIVVMLGTTAENRLKEKKLSYSTTHTPGDSLQMLQDHAVDLWAVHDVVARYFAQQQHVTLRQVLPLAHADSWLGCSRSTNSAAANRLAAALQQLQQNGEARRIALRYYH